ncbi:transposase [Micromonospora sp. ATA32]|nr:transposase [Micromonospora sp. ATA32]
MSHAVNTSTVTLHRGQDVQPHALLGSRTTIGTRHRGLGGRHQHHPPARPPATPVHLGPQYDIHRLVKQIKASSALLRQEVSHLKPGLTTLWTHSYFVATTGGATLEVIKRHVDSQRSV